MDEGSTRIWNLPEAPTLCRSFILKIPYPKVLTRKTLGEIFEVYVEILYEHEYPS
jgi:hypothetical protein